MVAGVLPGRAFPAPLRVLGKLEVARANLPVGLLIRVMIVPMLLRVDFGALPEVRQHWRGIGITPFVNWVAKPFSMALPGALFIRHPFAAWLPAGLCRRSSDALEHALARLAPWSVSALPATLILLFSLQGRAILHQPLVIALLAVPIVIQVLLNTSLAYGLNRLAGEAHSVA